MSQEKKPCNCNVSTNIAESLSCGTGNLDFNGFWEFPCTHGLTEYFKHKQEPSMTPIPPIPEDLPEICKEYCKDCGAETATWFTDSDIWNLLDTPGILCPNCFVHLIEARGFSATGWKLVPEERIAKLTAANEELERENTRLKALIEPRKQECTCGPKREHNCLIHGIS